MKPAASKSEAKRRTAQGARDRTHYADEATLEYIRQLEQERGCAKCTGPLPNVYPTCRVSSITAEVERLRNLVDTITETAKNKMDEIERLRVENEKMRAELTRYYRAENERYTKPEGE